MLKSFNLDQLFTASILFFGALILALSGLLTRFDNVFFDASQYFSFKNPPEDIVIVAIDERSLDAIGKWPWRREIHAELLKTISLAQPKAIGIDLFFSEPDSAHPQDDQMLSNVINVSKLFVLPVVIDMPFQNANIAQSAALSFFNAAPHGRVNVPLDVDGIARGIYLWEAVSPDGKAVLGIPHFSQAVLKVAGQLPAALDQPAPLLSPAKNKQGFFSHRVWQFDKKIHFYGPPGHFMQVSYSSVLSGEVQKDFFKNKIVLVGATAVGMGDVLATPVSGYTKPMSGVEFHANAIETIRQNQLITVAPIWITAVICAIFAVLPVLWLPMFKPFQALLLISIYFVVLIILMMVLPIATKYWIPATPVLLMTLLAYPIWSWRRLERAQTFLNAALEELKADLKQYGDASQGLDDPYKNSTIDLFQSRIAQVKNTTHLLRELHKNRNDTLSFISHDIRAPLATVLMMLHSQDFIQQKESMIKMLDRANHLAEHFLQISRAEVVSPAQFKALALNGLMQEVVDNIYHLAHVKHIKINLTLDEDPLWVNGEFSLLQRTFENILLNAVKYSPENTLVTVAVAKENQHAQVCVTDQGFGIAAEKIPQLFKKYSRLEATAHSTQGNGLGLYFVALTIRKHAGTVAVESVLGQSSTFTITLPLIN